METQLVNLSSNPAAKEGVAVASRPVRATQSVAWEGRHVAKTVLLGSTAAHAGDTSLPPLAGFQRPLCSLILTCIDQGPLL